MQVWLNTDALDNAVRISQYLNKRVLASKNELKAFVIQLDHGDGKSVATKLFETSKADAIGTCFIKNGDAGSASYKINDDKLVKNTVFVYVKKRVTAKFVNLVADEAGLKKLGEAIDEVDK